MRVLLIDDSETIRRFVRIVLEDAGHEVAEAENGVEGLRQYRALGADVVITDLFMPDMDGLDVIQTLVRESPGVGIVAISGGGFDGLLDMLPIARCLGAVEVLHKPLRSADLLAAVERVGVAVAVPVG